MNKYRVSLGFIQWDDYIVEAKDEADALEIAQGYYEQGIPADSEGDPHRTVEHDEAHEE